MSTPFDWLALALFCAVALTYLQRSLTPPKRRERVLEYVPPALGCVAGNWLGNEGYPVAGGLLLAAAAAYFLLHLRPLRRS